MRAFLLFLCICIAMVTRGATASDAGCGWGLSPLAPQSAQDQALPR